MISSVRIILSVFLCNSNSMKGATGSVRILFPKRELEKGCDGLGVSDSRQQPVNNDPNSL